VVTPPISYPSSRRFLPVMPLCCNPSIPSIQPCLILTPSHDSSLGECTCTYLSHTVLLTFLVSRSHRVPPPSWGLPFAPSSLSTDLTYIDPIPSSISATITSFQHQLTIHQFILYTPPPFSLPPSLPPSFTSSLPSLLPPPHTPSLLLPPSLQSQG